MFNGNIEDKLNLELQDMRTYCLTSFLCKDNEQIFGGIPYLPKL
jgi:hypothetical protein